MSRSIVSLLVVLILVSTQVAAAAPLARSGVSGGLARQGLSLRYDDPIADLAPEEQPAEPVHKAGGREEKKPLVAMLMSFAVPGWGEFYAGHDGRGRAFMAAEGAIWIGYASYSVQERMRTDDFEEYVSVYLDVEQGADHTYYEDIADYMRSEGSDSYNEDIRSEARSLFPDDLDAQERYFTEHGYFGGDGWDWGTRDRLEEYRELRHGASVSSRNAFYMTGLAVLNRALSGIDAAWMARRHNAGQSGSPAARLSVAPVPDENGLCGSRATLEISF